MRPIPFHNLTRLFTLVIKPSPVANNLGLSAHRAFAFGPSRRWNRSLMTGVKGNLPTVSLDTLTRRAFFHPLTVTMSKLGVDNVCGLILVYESS